MRSFDRGRLVGSHWGMSDGKGRAGFERGGRGGLEGGFEFGGDIFVGRSEQGCFRLARNDSWGGG